MFEEEQFRLRISVLSLVSRQCDTVLLIRRCFVCGKRFMWNTISAQVGLLKVLSDCEPSIAKEVSTTSQRLPGADNTSIYIDQ